MSASHLPACLQVGEAKTNMWFHALEIRQRGEKEFVKVDPEKCWMPYAIQKFVLEPVTE
jgi:hypothetical protein